MSKRKTEQRLEIVKLLNEGLTLADIGNKFSISKQRVYQIARDSGYNRNSKINEFHEKTYTSILSDIDEGLSYNEIVIKYGKYSVIRYNQRNKKTLKQLMVDKRDRNIISSFILGETAKGITIKVDTILDNPNRINCIQGIYKINSKHGIKRFPTVGNRNGGGIFEDRKILQYI